MRYIHDTARPGTHLHIKGPRNHFRLEPEAAHYILVAGGIGITPVLAMADRLRADRRSYEIHVAGRSLRAMPLLDRLRIHTDRLTLYPSSTGQRLDIAALCADPKPDTQIYACGPDRLIAALEHHTTHWPQDSLRVEHFTSGHTQLDPDHEHAFDIELRDSARTLRVGADQTVLQALRDRVLTTREKAAGDRMMTCCSRAAAQAIVLGL